MPASTRMRRSVEDRQPGDAGIDENAPESGTAVGEGRQRRVRGPPDRVEASAELLFDVRTGLGHGAENLPPVSLRFNIADNDLQMPLAVLAAPDEGRIQARIDRRCRRFRPGYDLIPK